MVLNFKVVNKFIVFFFNYNNNNHSGTVENLLHVGMHKFNIKYLFIFFTVTITDQNSHTIIFSCSS